MSDARAYIPKKIRVFAFILILIGIGAGVSGYIQPAILVQNFTVETPADSLIAMMFAGRNLALGIAMLGVFLWGTAEMFALMFAIRFMIEVVDVTSTAITAPSIGAVFPLIVFLSVFVILEAWALATMLRVVKNRPSGRA